MQDINEHPDYYKSLTEEYPDYIPSPYEKPISMDLERTFPEEEYFKKPENLQKLNRILLAYTKRNISLGYAQGFNFIVGRLLQVLDNEVNIFLFFKLGRSFLDIHPYFRGVYAY
ncbi:MAG: TBC domain-containing protein [archaeon]|nr:TBC domain-containing protein [archaeon]